MAAGGACHVVQAFPITGGDVTYYEPGSRDPFVEGTIEHEGSGLSGTEGDIRRAAKGAAVAKGLAIHGSGVDGARPAIEKWIKG